MGAHDESRIDRARPCETHGRRKSDDTAFHLPPLASYRSRFDFRQLRKHHTHTPGFHLLVIEKNLFGGSTEEHLVRVPQAPGHGILGERLSVQQRHDDGVCEERQKRTSTNTGGAETEPATVIESKSHAFGTSTG